MNGLKEWATVVKALENGKQTIILRKGGILETASGFNLESKKFLLFPTWEHQEPRYVKSEFHGFLKDVLDNKPDQGFNTISSYAEVLDEKDIESKTIIDRLSEFHVWSNSYIDERVNWKPEKPLKAIFLRTYNISQFNLQLDSSFEGCKSWVEINSNFDLGQSVLNETEIKTKLEKFRSTVNEV